MRHSSHMLSDCRPFSSPPPLQHHSLRLGALDLGRLKKSKESAGEAVSYWRSTSGSLQVEERGPESKRERAHRPRRSGTHSCYLFSKALLPTGRFSPVQRFFSSSSSSCLRTARSPVPATATATALAAGQLGRLPWDSGGVGRMPERKRHLESPLLLLSRGREAECCHKSRGSPEPSLQIGDQRQHCLQRKTVASLQATSPPWLQLLLNSFSFHGPATIRF
ncbi:uncharacterized protein [Symphalangus syndactylus]|uniref:uncharacterized protein n=1 Tax=Symphalangus syndactylus TaxID=9590 RepID=UPI003006E7C7